MCHVISHAGGFLSQIQAAMIKTPTYGEPNLLKKLRVSTVNSQNTKMGRNRIKSFLATNN